MACEFLKALSQHLNGWGRDLSEVQSGILVLSSHVFQQSNIQMGWSWNTWLPEFEMMSDTVTEADWLLLCLWETCVDYRARPQFFKDEAHQSLVTGVAQACSRRSAWLPYGVETKEWLQRVHLVSALHAQTRYEKLNQAQCEENKESDRLLRQVGLSSLLVS